MTDLDIYTHLVRFVEQIGFGKISPEMIIQNGKISKMKVSGVQSYLYNRTGTDANDNTQAIKHISQRINSALTGQDTKELVFNINFNRGKIVKVGWNSEFFIDLDEIEKMK